MLAMLGRPAMFLASAAALHDKGGFHVKINNRFNQRH
jgi:hypothetical protein